MLGLRIDLRKWGPTWGQLAPNGKLMARCFRLAIFLVLFVASLSALTAILYGGYSSVSNDLHRKVFKGKLAY